MRSLRVLLLVCLPLSLLGLSGCKSSCRALTERLCECKRTSPERNACLREAAEQESRTPLTAEEEAWCEEALPKCDALLENTGCGILQTEEGKRTCGLAR